MDERETFPDGYCLSVAKEIQSQIIANIGKMAYWSWGPTNQLAMALHPDVDGTDISMPCLAMKVNGFKFKGIVYVALDMGTDSYRIYTRKKVSDDLVLVDDEVYCDNVGEILDKFIETGDDSKEEYKKNVTKKYGF